MLFQASMQDSGIWIFFGVILLFLLIFGLAVFMTVFWIWMIVDCATRKKLSDGERIAWILVLVFLHVLGAGIYYFAVKRK